MSATPHSPESVVLLHGFGSSFTHEWEQTGWLDALEDLGLSVPRIDLPGHGSAAQPTDPAAYAAMEEEIAAQLPPGPVSAIGFSLGARTLLTIASRAPERFRRLVVMGVGDGVFDPPGEAAVARAVADGADPADPDPLRQVFARLARHPRNHASALAALLRRPPQPTLSPTALSAVSAPVLVLIGAADFMMPAERLAKAFPNGELRVIPGLDHFRTPGDPRAMTAVLQFLARTGDSARIGA